MVDKTVDKVTAYRVHARTGNHDCMSPWFLERKKAQDYPDKNWTDINIEERQSVIIDGDIFVMSDTGLYNPDHE